MSRKYTEGISGRKYSEDGSWLNDADYLKHNTTPFNESKTTEKRQQLILNSGIPVSELRDGKTEINGGTITKQGAEYRVRATSTSGSIARLRSLQRGDYLAGNVLEAGQGVRIPTQPTGDGKIKVGYWLGDTGFYFLYDSEGVHVVVEDGGTIVQKRSQSDWNIDKLDGENNTNNPSGATLDLSSGTILQIPFVYYGYGPIEFEVGIQDINGRWSLIPVHSIKRDGSVSLSMSNLPLNIEVNSGTSGTQLDCFVGGRQISTFGGITSVSRDVGSYRLEQSIGGTFIPTVSFRIKTGFENIPVKLSGLSFISDLDLIWRIRLGGSLTGADWGVAEGYTESETATEWDKVATAGSDGHVIKGGLAEGGNKQRLTATDLPERPVYEDKIVSVETRTVSGQGATVTTYFENKERW